MRPVEGELLQAERASAILAQLTPRQREAVILVARGYTQEEAAKELGITQPGVAKRLSRASDRAKRHIAVPKMASVIEWL